MKKVTLIGSDFPPSEPIVVGGGSWRRWREIAAKVHFFIGNFTPHGSRDTFIPASNKKAFLYENY